MRIKSPYSSEGYYHICNNFERWTKETIQSRLMIFTHDISSFVETYNRNGKAVLMPVRYCPYCGQELDRDTDGTAEQEKKAAKILFAERR